MSREHAELQRSYQVLYEKLRQLTCFSDSDAANVNYATLQAENAAARARIRDLEEILQLKQQHDAQVLPLAPFLVSTSFLTDRFARRTQATQRPAVPSLLEIQAAFLREKHSLNTQLQLLQHQLEQAHHKSAAVQQELNESRDQNELLEFRILELEECQERVLDLTLSFSSLFFRSSQISIATLFIPHGP